MIGQEGADFTTEDTEDTEKTREKFNKSKNDF